MQPYLTIPFTFKLTEHYIDKIKASGLLADIKDIQGVAGEVSFAKKIMNIKATSKVLELKPKTVIDFVLLHPIDLFHK
jgi:hypothetical protein